MRVAIVSDIHANLAALDAVFAHLESEGRIDAVWNMGDCVGYGPQPSECIAHLRSAGATWVAGNHERAATGAIDTGDFNPAAAAAALWTQDRLDGAEKAFLDSLPEIAEPGDGFVLVHGTLRDPVWEYLIDTEAARAHLSLMSTQFGFVGHTHVPMVVTEDLDSPDGCRLSRLHDGQSVALGGSRKLVVNPGSVGQPRDGDARASYGVFDDDTMMFTLSRVDYDIGRTQRLMEGVGLPPWLSERLSIGR